MPGFFTPFVPLLPVSELDLWAGNIFRLFIHALSSNNKTSCCAAASPWQALHLLALRHPIMNAGSELLPQCVTGHEAQSDFMAALVDALEEQVSVINEHGTIIYVNDAWRRFGEENGIQPNTEWRGSNYLDACRQAKGDRIALRVANGIERMLSAAPGASVTVEYPCHSPTEQRWFLMRATRMTTAHGCFVVVVHENITRRKLAEQRAAALAVRDPLTGLANRRAFNQELNRAWSRCRRAHSPLSLLSIDIDHFKKINDTFGHPAGDACLKSVARIIKKHARRPEDLAARVGGEEFTLLLPETELGMARNIAEHLHQAISHQSGAEGVPHAAITASIGLVGIIPTHETRPEMLLTAADVALYAAKRDGRNRVILGVA